ncbi:histidine phosphatase family protein [Deinococcus taeanensis]|uniref:histidine phosphatase family protein n=1 Tax=Deinococcus taeanensis TaxID=2737050 RepID=UPI001CDC22A2|nr:histidine phosphatase family protein [Deinococcus taeanensis]UBV42577.1 histidine phosphatase family protein [Deinococcus taeanensis]
MLTLHLVRHAPTVPNEERRYPHAHEDAPLTPAGAALAARLPLPRAAPAFTSPSGRARQTAALAGFPAAQPTPALAEAAFGVMAGHTWAALEARYGEAPRAWIEALADPVSPHGPPGGETGQAFHARLHGWLNALPREGEVVAFTHAGPLLAALCLTVGLRSAAAPPGTVVTLHCAGEWWLSRLRPPD